MPMWGWVGTGSETIARELATGVESVTFGAVLSPSSLDGTTPGTGLEIVSGEVYLLLGFPSLPFPLSFRPGPWLSWLWFSISFYPWKS